MGERIPIPLPLGGVAEITSFHTQPTGSSRQAGNVGSRDPITGRYRPAQRSGQSKHTAAQITVGNKIQRVIEFGYDLRNIAFTNRGDNIIVDTSVILPAALDAKHLVRDRYGDIYVMDGPAGVAKYNQHLVLVWKLAVPTKDPAHVCRALFVDSSLRVFVGVSEGGDPKKAAVFVYRQIEEKKTELMYSVDTDAQYVEAIAERDSITYMALNNTRTWRSRVRGYVGVEAKNPTIAREWDAAYPINDMDISVADGTVGLAHGPNNRRGLSPQSPDYTAPSQDWDPNMLTDASLRLWAWWDATDIDGDGSNNNTYKDGDQIDRLSDKTGNFRSWITRTVTGEVGFLLRKGAIAGRDSLFMNGKNCSMQSEAGVSTDRAYRHLNRTAIPCYDGAQFALFMAVRVPASQNTDTVNLEKNGRRWLFGQHRSTVLAEARAIFCNAYPNGTAANTALYGNMYLFEDTTAQPTANDRAQGTGDLPLAGAFNEDGIVILAWVFDGGIDDVASVPTRSTFYINGRPCDRWHSWSGYSNLLPCFLGWSQDSAGARFEATANTIGRFLGDFCEGFVLADYATTDFGITTAQARQRLITLPTYPDANWSANGDTEFERCVGYLANRWGAAHKLPSGQYAALQLTAALVLNETVTIDGVVYRWRDPSNILGGGVQALLAINDIAIGADAFNSLLSLCKAVNLSGIAGTDYFAGTAANPNVTCIGVVREGENLIATLMLQSRNGNIAAAFGTTETMAGAGNAFLNGATSVDTRNSAVTARGGYNSGHYPHSFYLYKTTRSAGGPPRDAGVTTTSIPGALVSPYGMLSLWDPANGKVRAVLTSNGPGTSALPVGGVGYGVRFNSVGDIINVGPRQAATSLFIAEDVDARKVVRTSAGVLNLVNGATAASAWTAAPGAFTNPNVRMDVDKYDNVFIPMARGDPIVVGGANWTDATKTITKVGAFANYVWAAGDTFNITAGTGVTLAEYTIASRPNNDTITLTADINGAGGNIVDNSINGTVGLGSLVGYKRIAPSSAQDSALILNVHNLPSDANAYGVVVDTSYPDYPTSFSATYRPEFLYLATRREGSQQIALWKVSLVSRAQGVASPRARTRVAVSNGDLVAFTPGSNTLLLAGALDANARYIDYATGYAQLVLTDGRRYVVYDPRQGTVSNLRSKTSGQIPLGARLLNFYNGRLWLACFNDDPHNMAWSKRNDINDYNFHPRVPTVDSAIDATVGGLGRYPDIVRGIANIEDDLGIVFGDSSIFTLRGDPAEAGRFDQISSKIGGVFGRGWTTDDRRRLWFISSEAQLCLLTGNGIQPVSDDSLHMTLRQIDFANFYTELIWNPEDRCLHLWLFPYAAGDTLATHYIYDPNLKAFWPYTFGNVNVQPTAACIINGDAAVDRRMLLGRRDGWIANWDRTAKDDDGTAIDSFLLIGPFNNTALEIEAAFDDLEVVLASDQGGCMVEIYVTNTPDTLGEPVFQQRVEAGRNPYIPRIFSGNYVAVGLRGLGVGTRWALDSLSVAGTRIGAARK